MFTGLVQAMGTVTEMKSAEGGCRITVEAPGIASAAGIGESIAVNGACLTVVENCAHTVSFEAGPETLARTTLRTLQIGERVNMERALRLGDPLGGHLVTGHVDGQGKILDRIPDFDFQTVWFECPAELDDLLVHKGSVCVDGVSLTLNDVTPGRFSVMLIPHTLSHTTLGAKPVGAAVNLEADVLAKHVKKLFTNLTINL